MDLGCGYLHIVFYMMTKGAIYKGERWESVNFVVE